MQIWGPVLDLQSRQMAVQPGICSESENHRSILGPTSSFYPWQVGVPPSEGVKLIHCLTDSLVLETHPFLLVFPPDLLSKWTHSV